ncbi:MAG: HEAT repeat domain-containing protein [Clostridia bacterium]|nr:HEAT repeat domain-containing protein [Clostridia bacterium]
MAKIDKVRDKIMKLAAKQKIDAVLKFADDSEDDVRVAVAEALAYIPTYESGMALIPFLRDVSPSVRAAAATSAATINAKHCEEYVKKLAFADADPYVREVAKRAFDVLKTSVM